MKRILTALAATAIIAGCNTTSPLTTHKARAVPVAYTWSKVFRAKDMPESVYKRAPVGLSDHTVSSTDKWLLTHGCTVGETIIIRRSR